MILRIFFHVVAVSALLYSSSAAEWTELSDTLIQHTFKIEGPSTTQGKNTVGTVFIVSKIPTGATNFQARTVLITAAHVLNDIVGDNATIYFRRYEGSNRYSRVPTNIVIRSVGKPLWIQHPEVDVAAMYVSVPPFVSAQTKSVPVPGTEFFADDETYDRYKIHTGEELLCLGFPYGAEANSMGFSILRSGRIASFPLTPAKQLKSFLFDFEVFGGNSGGPVFLMDAQRRYGTTISRDIIQFIVGLVSEEQYGIERIVKPIENSRGKTRVEIEETRERLGLAIVIPAVFIRETIDMLDKSPTTKN